MMEKLAETVSTLERLVAYPTVSSDSNLDLVADVAQHLEDCGARVDIFHDATGCKANVFATLGPEADGGIVLSGHTDVVPVSDQTWKSDPFTLRHSDDLLYGRGTCDMKGFIAAALVMAPRYARTDLRRPVHFSFSYDEEVGCLGARSLLPELQKRGISPTIAIIGEPTEMRVIEGHKGCCEYTTHFTGRAGHGSAPDRGVNAVEFATRYVSKLMELRGALMMRAPQNSRFQPPWTTLNVGRFTGGSAHNVIASSAEVAWEMRPVQKSDQAYVNEKLASYIAEDLLPVMQAIAPEADIRTEVVGEISGLEIMDDNAARDLVCALVGGNSTDVVAFGTEAGLFQQTGMSAVVCGPGSIHQAHKPDEYVSLGQLESCLEMLDGLGRSLVTSAP